MSLVLSLLCWSVCIHAVFVFSLGNPAYLMVKQAPPVMLRAAADILDGELAADNESIDAFLRNFFRWTTIGLALFVLELMLAVYFAVTQPWLPLSWFILAKGAVMLRVGYRLNRQAPPNILLAVRQTPAWLARWDRASYLLTGVCFFVFFLLVNGLLV